MTASDATFTPIRPGVLATEVRKQIRSRILDGTVRPGEPLKDSVLAASMGVSRSPVREALQMLEQAGLLEKTPNKSYVVKTFTDRDMEEVAMLRIAYETLAVQWLVEHKTSVADLEPHLERMAASDGFFRSGLFRFGLVGRRRRPGNSGRCRDSAVFSGLFHRRFSLHDWRRRGDFDLLGRLRGFA